LGFVSVSIRKGQKVPETQENGQMEAKPPSRDFSTLYERVKRGYGWQQVALSAQDFIELYEEKVRLEAEVLLIWGAVTHQVPIEIGSAIAKQVFDSRPKAAR
jgi:hypothetical protein